MEKLERIARAICSARGKDPMKIPVGGLGKQLDGKLHRTLGRSRSGKALAPTGETMKKKPLRLLRPRRSHGLRRRRGGIPFPERRMVQLATTSTLSRIVIYK